MARDEKMPRLVAEPHTQLSPIDPLIRSFRMTPDDREPSNADYILANPPINHSDTALRARALSVSEATMQVVSEAKDHFRKDNDVRWQCGVPLVANLPG